MKNQILRWVLAVVAVMGAFVAMMPVTLALSFVLPWPRDLVDTTVGLVAAVNVILCGAFLAPRFQVRVACILFLSLSVGTALMAKSNFVGTIVGGIAALLLIARYRRLISVNKTLGPLR